ncbi:hypothetical protein [Marinobacterium stanieri]|uniref:hypothetical protein n=1 Tax=Marinobacterium stanieri TaxID=49186 RepID=UPI0009709B6F|nr:hypothetical protein [Marinobacterium stanieri]
MSLMVLLLSVVGAELPDTELQGPIGQVLFFTRAGISIAFFRLARCNLFLPGKKNCAGAYS